MKTTIKLLLGMLIMLAAYTSRAQCGGPISYYFVNGGQVSFIDSANLNLQVSWNFGDGDTANNSNFQVSHTYTHNGTYNVCITVSDPPTCSVTYCDTVVINLCAGLASISISQTGFGDYSFGPNTTLAGSTYQWSFGDGNTSASGNTSHQYATSGSYNIGLIVSNATAGCADTSAATLDVSLCSFASNFNYDSLYTTGPESFEVVSPVAGYTYTWRFGDGTTGTGDSVTHQYGHFDNYTYCLITSDAVTGCTDSNCNASLIDPCGIYANINEGVNGLIATFSVGFGWQSQGQSGLTYAWSFPDATPSSATTLSAIANYPTTGTYTANLTVTNAAQCADTLSQSVSITSPVSYYGISGVATENGSGACVTVYLIIQDTTGHLALLDSVVNIDSLNLGCSGQYTFSNLPTDTYYVKAAVNVGDPSYANYLPTYYGDVLHWSDATPVILSNSGATANIDLIAGSNPGGPGFVSGWISQGAGLVLQTGNNTTRGTGSLLSGVQVNLLTSNNDPVAYTYSNANGQFTFSNLAYNSYKIYIERLNIAVVPDTFTLSAQNPGDTTLSIVVDSNTASSINDLSGISVSAIFPNPVSTVADVMITSKVTADATLTLNDMLGQSVATQRLHLVNGLNKAELNMADLAPGVYEVVVQANNQQLTYKIVKAK